MMRFLRWVFPIHLYQTNVAAAIVGGAVVGGAISASGSKSAAGTQAGAADRATAAQEGMFNQAVQNNAPYNQAGQAASGRLSELLGNAAGTQTQGNFDANAYLAANPDVAKDPYFSTHPWEHYQQYGKNENRQFTPVAGTGSQAADFGSLAKPFSMSDFQLDPGIQFQTQQGNLALTNSAAAKNGVLSGGALKDFIAYNQGMAGTGYQSAYDRYMANKQFTLGSLMGQAQLGQTAASNGSTGGSSYASGISGTITGAGNAGAAGTMGAANALSGAATSAGNGYALSRLLNGGSATGGVPNMNGLPTNGNGAYDIPNVGTYNNPSAYIA